MTTRLKQNKIISVILAISMVLTVFCVGAVHTAAVSYPSVTLDVPRISQRPDTGDCAIASISTVEAFMYGYPSGDYTSEIYEAVYAANNYSIGASWGQLGYYSIGEFQMETAYNQLASGYPVIVHRTSSHYSVIYAYVGNSEKLEISGFMIEDVDDSYSDTTAKKNLDQWTGRYSLDQMVIRQNGLPVPQKKITITCNHPPKYLVKGKTFSVFGNIVSNYAITSVKISILDSKGQTAKDSSFEASPKAKYFYISSGDSKMNFSKLNVGDYTYKIVAKDSSGASATFSYGFSVILDDLQIPDDPITYTSQTSTSQTTKKISYNAVVTADPCLNLRSGAGENYQILDTIPKGTSITISAVTNSWGQTTYKGHTGWVSLSYIKETTTQKTTSTTKTTTKPSTTKTTKTTTTTTKTTQQTTKSPSGSSIYVITENNSVMRSGATMLSSYIQTVPANTILKVTQKSGFWYKVKYNNQSGWILYSSTVQNIGDIDSDGRVTSTDALYLLRYATGSATLTQTQIQVADLDGNKIINSTDALTILKIVIGNYD